MLFFVSPLATRHHHEISDLWEWFTTLESSSAVPNRGASQSAIPLLMGRVQVPKFESAERRVFRVQSSEAFWFVSGYFLDLARSLRSGKFTVLCEECLTASVLSNFLLVVLYGHIVYAVSLFV